jgi:hypothetical protein
MHLPHLLELIALMLLGARIDVQDVSIPKPHIQLL